MKTHTTALEEVFAAPDRPGQAMALGETPALESAEEVTGLAQQPPEDPYGDVVGFLQTLQACLGPGPLESCISGRDRFREGLSVEPSMYKYSVLWAVVIPVKGAERLHDGRCRLLVSCAIK